VRGGIGPMLMPMIVVMRILLGSGCHVLSSLVLMLHARILVALSRRPPHRTPLCMETYRQVLLHMAGGSAIVAIRRPTG
jgi:hypothetical protein